MAYSALEAAQERERLLNKLRRGESLTPQERQVLPYLNQRCTKACTMIVRKR